MADSVPNFQSLPLTVRRKIWVLSLPQRTVGGVLKMKDGVNLVVLSDVLHPAALSVCRESRAVTSHLYLTLFVACFDLAPRTWVSRVLFNPSLDTWRGAPLVAVVKLAGGQGRDDVNHASQVKLYQKKVPISEPANLLDDDDSQDLSIQMPKLALAMSFLDNIEAGIKVCI